MGDALRPEVIEAFFSELDSMEKEAGARELFAKFVQPKKLKGFAKSLTSLPGKGWQGLKEETGKFVKHLNPFYSIPAGWKHMTPAANEELLRKVRQAAHGVEGVGRGAAEEAMKPSRGPGLLKRYFGEAGMGHMLGTSPEAGRVQALAEELSRRGWTGQGAVTKYLPLGGKTVALGFGASAVPGVYRAATTERHPLGEGGPWEKGLEGAADTAAWFMGAPLGLSGLPIYFAAPAIGRGAGRIIDRLRAGASPRAAVSAPSPEEAAEQMQAIQRYYG